MKGSEIPWFPFDVRLGDSFELIEAEFGLTGFAVVVKLLQKIYGKQGYYCEWTKDVALLFSKKIGLGGNVVFEIVSAAIRRGIFDKELYNEYSILTSTEIQKNYFEAVSRRKAITVKKEYLLIDCAQICKNVNISFENVNIFCEKDNNCEHSKEEYRKENDSKEKERKPNESIVSSTYVPTSEKTDLEIWWEQHKRERGY